MAKKSGKDKKKSSDGEDARLVRHAEEIESNSSALKKLRKENDGFATRLKKLEKDDGLVRRVRTLEKESGRSVRKVESLSEELKKVKAAVSVRRRKDSKASSRNGKGQRPNEESEPIITKAAEKEAVRLGVNLSKLKGTGTEGRITVSDVRKKSDGKSARKSKK